MTDDWKERVGGILLPGEDLEEAPPSEVAPPVISVGGKLYTREDAPPSRTQKRKKLPSVFRPSDDFTLRLDATEGIKQEQERLGVPADGIVGPRTLKMRKRSLSFIKFEGRFEVLVTPGRRRTFDKDEDKVRSSFYVLGDAALPLRMWSMRLIPSKIYWVPFDARTQPELWSLVVEGKLSMDVYTWPDGAKNGGDGTGGVQMCSADARVQWESDAWEVRNLSNTLVLLGSGIQIEPGAAATIARSALDANEKGIREMVARGILRIREASTGGPAKKRVAKRKTKKPKSLEGMLDDYYSDEDDFDF